MTTETPAEIRLARYADRSTWSNATYGSGNEKALHEIALDLKAEVDRLRAELADQSAYEQRLREQHDEDVKQLGTLRARVAELAGPAVQARAALAALCYDLEDPGSNAFGALYLISQATTGVEAPKDDAALALGQHAAQVLHKVADLADPEPPEVSFFGPTFGPQIAEWLRMLANRPKSAAAIAAP